jgi:hypothetical protein
LSYSWGPADFAATQGLPSIWLNPKFHHRVHSSLPLVPMLRQTKPVHITPTCLSKVHFNVMDPITPLWL